MLCATADQVKRELSSTPEVCLMTVCYVRIFNIVFKKFQIDSIPEGILHQHFTVLALSRVHLSILLSGHFLSLSCI